MARLHNCLRAITIGIAENLRSILPDNRIGVNGQVVSPEM